MAHCTHGAVLCCVCARTGATTASRYGYIYFMSHSIEIDEHAPLLLLRASIQRGINQFGMFGKRYSCEHLQFACNLFKQQWSKPNVIYRWVFFSSFFFSFLARKKNHGFWRATNEKNEQRKKTNELQSRIVDTNRNEERSHSH